MSDGAGDSMTDSTLRYRLDLARPGHEVGVTATFPKPPVQDGVVRLYMPRWAPGSYLIREFARLVDWMEAEQDGRPIPVVKDGPDGWRAEGMTEGGPLVLRYGLYAHELTVRTNYLGEDRALLCGAATYVVPVGCEGRPARVEIEVPAHWPAAECPLPMEGNEHAACDYDELVDAPIAAGPCRIETFTARGVPHRIAVYGAGDTDPAVLASDAQAIAEAAADIFGGEIPSREYLFLIELGCGGGLEHADSSVCGFPTLAFATEAERRRSLSLVAHEYFHLWNIKRIRPQGLGPFDYRREAHVPHLWVAEGITSYYQHVICLRADLISPGRFLATWAAYVHEAEAAPGQRYQSLRASSHDAWIKYYRQHENSSNVQVSYYGKGALAGLVLDLEIRRRTKGERSLDDVFRALWARFRETGDAYDDVQLRDAFAEAAGSRMDEAIDEVAERAQAVDVEKALRSVGLALVRRPAARGGFLGMFVRRTEGRVVIDRVLRDGPAWSARLAPGEEIVGLDGWRVDEPDLRARMDASRPGQAVTLTTSLAGRLREVRVELKSKPSQDYRIQKLRHADAGARAMLTSWIGTEWDGLEPLDEIHEELRPGRGPRPV